MSKSNRTMSGMVLNTPPWFQKEKRIFHECKDVISKFQIKNIKVLIKDTKIIDQTIKTIIFFIKYLGVRGMYNAINTCMYVD